MKTRPTLLALSALLLAGAAQAQPSGDRSPYYMDGEQLLAYCSQDDDLSKGACSGYVAGAIDMIAAMNLARRRVLVCVPPEMELRRLADIVVARLRDQPDLRRYAATGQLIVALGEAFPCDGERQGAGLDRSEPPAEAASPDQPAATAPEDSPLRLEPWGRSEPRDQFQSPALLQEPETSEQPGWDRPWPDAVWPPQPMTAPSGQADQPQQTERPEEPRPEPPPPEDIRPEYPWPASQRNERPWPDQPWPDQQW